MKAYQVVEYGKPLKCCEVEIPKPQNYEVLVKTLVTGVCHTDLHVISGDLSDDLTLLPRTPGHEGIGIIVSMGPKVKKFKKGDRVGIPWLGQACTECNLCKTHRENLCLKQLNTGYTCHGSFAEYFLADERFAVKIPAEISDVNAAPIICAGLTSYKALKAANVPAKSRIVISGACGGLGHLAIQFAKLLNLKVIALDFMNEERKEMVKKLGAAFIVDLSERKDVPVEQKLLELDSPKEPIEAAIILAPVLSAVTEAVHYVSPGGCIVCVGLPKGSYTIPCSTFILKELRLIGQIVGTPKDLEEALDIASRGYINPHVEVRDITTVQEVLDELSAGKISGRVVLRF